jgi:hypothetical protein
MKWAIPLIFILFGRVSAQNRTFAFYGDKFELPGCSATEKDSLLNEKVVPECIRSYIDDKIETINLKDWGLLYFLNAFVDAEFYTESSFNKVKVLNLLITKEGINNAIGIASGNRDVSLVSIDNKAKIINTQCAVLDGYKFISVKPNSNIRHLKNVDINGRAEYRDINLNYTDVPIFRNLMVKQKKACFFNYCLKEKDSITFSFSNAYNDFFNDLPRIIPDYHYYKAPVSSFFRTSIFQEIDKKISCCKRRIDSINFLIKFIQTAVQFEEDIKIYGKQDFCSFPENTMALGKGDCEDKCEAFAFLVNHYFPTIDIVFLFYPEHVRIGLGDTNTPISGEPYQEFEGKKYLEVELQSNDTVLADESFSIFHEVPVSIGR